MSTIAILGAGTWGSALAHCLVRNNHEVRLWSRFENEILEMKCSRTNKNLPEMVLPETVLMTADPLEALTGAEYVLVVVPSVYVRSTIQYTAPFISPDSIVTCASKGIEANSLKLLSEVIADELASQMVSVRGITALSGPTHAEEVARSLPTLIVSACEYETVAEEIQHLFDGSCIRPYTNTDLRGVEICGALKNVEALAVGVARGLGYGDNTAAALMTRGMEEIRRLGLAMGCQERTFFGLAGIGDLIVTATSLHSRNNRCGMLIGSGKPVQEAVREVGMVVEGLNTLPAAVELCRKTGMEMPIISAVRAIVQDGARPDDIVRELMSRKLKEE